MPLQTIKHSDVNSFITDRFQKNGRLLKSYSRIEYIQLLILLLLIVKVSNSCYHQEYSALFLLGVSIYFSFSILIIIHEIIHYLGYIILGKRDAYFGKVKKAMIFYVTTHSSKLNGYQYLFISMLPIVLITLFCIIFPILYNDLQLYYFTIPVMLCNYSFSKGDFAFCDYVLEQGISSLILWNKQETIYIQKTEK
ncbi:DUF3267 domain-containing protein [Flammeovirga pacifica]|uniref:DUF3267 domain-containing protein n=1 Tax=Flammeovirga pacifica TaxID=915059 RepID=A0A1S1Z2E9_FLAPC|nr:hypothetical protein NH26_14395 [Flammeovirga pacifica]